MILGMSVGAFTILPVIITLVAIGSGLIVVGGMFASDRLLVTTALFLFTTALTSVTGFLFPIHGFTPALGDPVILHPPVDLIDGPKVQIRPSPPEQLS
jgi:hypothetical protein